MKRLAWTALAAVVLTLVGCNLSFAHEGHEFGRAPDRREWRGHEHRPDPVRRDSGFGFGFDGRGFGFGFDRGGFGFHIERDDFHGPWPRPYAPRPWRW